MNFFAFRKPFDTQLHCGNSQVSFKGLRNGCFVVAPFGGDVDSAISIPFNSNCGIENLKTIIEDSFDSIVKAASSNNNFPEHSTSRENHKLRVEKIIAEIKKGNLKKCVAARTIVNQGRIDIVDTFNSLCRCYPASFVFLFFTPESGCWMGASPELLISARNNEIETMALAGTHKKGSNENWSPKETLEHQIVVEYIEDVLKSNNIKTTSLGPEIEDAGPVEHLKTTIKGKLNSGAQISSLISQLSPTPALAGYPRETAIELIEQTEDFSRGFYGGYCGWIDSKGDASFYVNLRSMKIEPERYCIFVGGGIMEDSNPDDEWKETEEKAKTITKVLSGR